MFSSHTEVTDEHPKYGQPDKIKTILKAHQKSMLTAMRGLETDTYNYFTPVCRIQYNFTSSVGILADKVGSGKSLTMLSLIATGKNSLDTKTTTNKITIKGINMESINYNNKFINTNIIITSHTIIKQWETYIKNDTNLTYFIINKKKDLDKIEKFENIYIELEKFDIILISSSRYRDLFNLLRNPSLVFDHENVIFLRVITDEADSISFSKPCLNYEFKSYFNWYITSSIKCLQNPYGKIVWGNDTGVHSDHVDWINHFTKRIYLNGITSKKSYIFNTFGSFSNSHGNYSKYFNEKIYLKNNDDYVSQSFMLEDPIVNIIKCLNRKVYNLLKNIVTDEVINLINAGEIAGAISKFQCQKTTNENLTSVVTKDLEQELHNKQIEFEMKSKMTFSTSAAKEQSLERINLAIHKFKSKIETLKNRLKENNICPICYDDVTNNTYVKCCNTSFCFECITMWLKDNKKCPHCRAHLNSSNIIVVTNEAPEEKKKETKLDDKMTNMKKLIDQRFRENSNSKILIFSEWESIYNELTPFLNESNITNSKVSGNMNVISKTIRRFKSTEADKLDVLLLNSRFCGSGLNIENATDVIIYHTMNPELETQVIGRAQRPGRTGKLNIWKMCYENELHF